LTGWLLDTNILSELDAQSQNRGSSVSSRSSLHHGLTVISRDTGGFKKAGVPVLNPWRETLA
jgi:hypothetical protein